MNDHWNGGGTGGGNGGSDRDGFSNVDPVDPFDPFQEDDAAYVMGALGPTERRAFEAHLADCPRCTRAVAELSGMPAMLDRVPLERVLQPGADREPPPDLLLAHVVRAARAERRRRSLLLVASGAVAATIIAVAVAFGVAQTGSEPPAGTTVAMSALRPVAVTGTLQVTPVAWGTKVSLVCQWVAPSDDAAGWSRKAYRLVAVPRDGGEPQTLATWAVHPGEDATVQGSTDLTTDDIARIELRLVDDDSVLLRAGSGDLQAS
jgi:anti-sigma factor RsiW